MRPLPSDVVVNGRVVGGTRVPGAASEYPVPYDFKPYVYRGTGEDTLTPHWDEPKPTPKRRAPRRRPKPQQKPQPPRNPKPENVLRWAPRKASVDLAPAKWVEPLPKPTVTPTPSPGWRPSSGAEIELLLIELEDE